MGFQYGGEVAESSSSEEDSGSDMELEEEEEAVGLAVGPASDEVPPIPKQLHSVPISA